MIAFTGFSDAPNNKFTTTVREKLEGQAQKLGLKIAVGENLDSSVTHVVAPPGTRTLKTLAACLGLRWLLVPRWLEESSSVGHLLEETKFGVRLSHRPLAGKNVFISDGFKTHKAFTAEHFTVLVERLGKGRISTSPFGADFLLLASSKEDQENYSMIPTGTRLNWSEFFELIQPSLPQ